MRIFSQLHHIHCSARHGACSVDALAQQCPVRLRFPDSIDRQKQSYRLGGVG